MTDQFSTYKTIGLQFASHQSVNHGIYEYARGEVHNNTAESFSAIVERAKQGVFHYWSKDHMQRYLHEVEFRWNHRVAKLKKTKKGTIKIAMIHIIVFVNFLSCFKIIFFLLGQNPENRGCIFPLLSVSYVF